MIRNGILIFLTLTCIQISAQDIDKLKFEQIALDYFSDSIATDFSGVRILTDGTIYNRGIDKKYLSYLNNEFFIGISNMHRDNERLFKKYLKEYEVRYKVLVDSLKPIEIDSIDYQGCQLEVKKPLINKRKINYKELKGGFFRFYGKKVYNFIFKDRYNLDITRQVFFDNKYWIRIRMDRPDLEYGNTFILRFDKNGEFLDYAKIEWIQ
jgi:hypothetical protein